MNGKTEKLRELVREKLTEDEIDCFVGYQRPISNWFSPPLILKDLKDLNKLTVNPISVGNLSLYLPDLVGGEEGKENKAGVIVKGCDSRALNVLLQEDIVARENLFIVGFPCEGILNPSKLREFYRRNEISVQEFFSTEFSWENGKIVGFTNDGKIELPKKEILLRKCRSCDYPNPIDFDVLLGSEVKPREKDFNRVEEIENLSLEEKWEYWSQIFDRCVRCYACRSVCPLCYCETCEVDPIDIPITPDTPPDEKANRPEWIERIPDVSSNLFFHILRSIHTAGRCVGCGECERVCPVDIPLTELTEKMEKEVREFNYVPGLDVERDQFLAEYEREGG